MTRVPIDNTSFLSAPTPTDPTQWETLWKLIIDVVLSNLDRGQHLTLSCAYVFGSMSMPTRRSAIRSTRRPRPCPVVPGDMVVTGGSTPTGNG
jgi:hypothetical protein